MRFKLRLSSAIILAVLGPLTALPSYAQQVSLSVANEGATGTTIGKLAKFTATNPVTAIIATTGDTDGVVGIVSGFSLQGSTGITGNAYISQVGITNCTFDTAGVTAKHYVVASTIAGGSCADGGATRPTGVQVIGIAQATGGSGASVAVQLDRGFANAAGSGSPANPTATAGPAAVNGAAGTFMRSDAAPAVQKGSNAQFGIVEGDGSTITCVAGVCSSISGGAGTVTNNGNLTTHAPIVGGTNGTTDVKSLAALTNGQFSIGVTSADPAAGSFGSDFTNSSNVINLAQRTTHGDSIYTILSTDRYIVTSATLTAPRAWTLPAASTLPAGTQYQVYDEFGGASGTNTIAITPNGTDTIDGVNSAANATIAVAYGGYTLKTDGSAKWTATANTVQQAYTCSAGTFASAQSASGVTTCASPIATTLATGTSVSLTAPREYYVCTGTCTVTPPVPAAGYEFCVMNDDNVTTVITLAALGSSARYEATARTSYGTAGTGTFVSGGAAGDKVCIVGRDSTHYLTTSFNGTWTAN